MSSVSPVLAVCRTGFLFLLFGTAELIDNLQGGLQMLLKRRRSPPRVLLGRVCERLARGECDECQDFKGQEREAAMRARQAEQTAHREETLARQESLSPVDRLRTILADDSVSMAWFPPEWGVVDADELAQLDTYEVERLLVLTRTRAARAWRGVRPALRADLARR